MYSYDLEVQTGDLEQDGGLPLRASQLVDISRAHLTLAKLEGYEFCYLTDKPSQVGQR